MPRSKEFLVKQTYPYRDHKRALKILRILDKKPDMTVNEIRYEMGGKAPYSHQKIRHTLRLLNEIGYCQEEEKTRKLTKWISLEQLNKLKQINGKFNPKSLSKNWHKINGFTFHKKNSSNYVLHRITEHGKKQFCVESRISRWKISFKGKLMLFVFEGKTLQRLLKETSDHRIFQRVQILIESNKSELVTMLLRRLRSSFIAGYNLEKTSLDWYDETTETISKMKVDYEKYPALAKLKKEIIENRERELILNTRNRI